jgi:hypothetical protein
MSVKLLLMSVLAVVIATGAFFVGRHSGDGRGVVVAAPDAHAVAPPAASAGTRKNAPARQVPCVVLPPLPAAPTEGAEQETVRSHRAEVLLDEVFQELNLHARRGLEPAETRANTVLPYLSGVLHGSLQADPGLRAAFSAQFTSALCERTLAEDQAISVAHMALLLPDIATKRGFDCFFRKAKESVPLWTMLDAWRRSGLEKTPTLAKLQASSTDSRTTRRFLSPEEAMAQRMPGALAAEQSVRFEQSPTTHQR